MCARLAGRGRADRGQRRHRHPGPALPARLRPAGDRGLGPVAAPRHRVRARLDAGAAAGRPGAARSGGVLALPAGLAPAPPRRPGPWLVARRRPGRASPAPGLGAHRGGSRSLALGMTRCTPTASAQTASFLVPVPLGRRHRTSLDAALPGRLRLPPWSSRRPSDFATWCWRRRRAPAVAESVAPTSIPLGLLHAGPGRGARAEGRRRPRPGRRHPRRAGRLAAGRRGRSTRLRQAVAAVPAEARSVGSPPINLDVRGPRPRDRTLIIPLVLGVLVILMLLLLRSIIAPLLLVATVVLSFLATLGVSGSSSPTSSASPARIRPSRCSPSCSWSRSAWTTTSS